MRKPNRKSVLFHRLTSRLKDARALYNQLQRRISQGNLKAGVVEKYMAAAHSRKDRFAMLKEFYVGWKFATTSKNTLQYDIVFFPEVPNHTLLQQGAKCMSKLISSSRAPSKDIIHGHMIHSANCPREAEKRNEDIYEKGTIVPAGGAIFQGSSGQDWVFRSCVYIEPLQSHINSWPQLKLFPGIILHGWRAAFAPGFNKLFKNMQAVRKVLLMAEIWLPQIFQT